MHMLPDLEICRVGVHDYEVSPSYFCLFATHGFTVEVSFLGFTWLVCDNRQARPSTVCPGKKYMFPGSHQIANRCHRSWLEVQFPSW